MFIALVVFHSIVSVLLILVVLLQQGKGEGMGSALGGGSSQSVFGARGAATFLSKFTTILAAIFMTTSLALAFHSSKDSSDSLLKEEEKVENLLEEIPATRADEATTDQTEQKPQDNPEKAAESTDELDVSPNTEKTKP
ncbi:MAG: preprotein translocase subunit SecG [Bdellovibrionota bacterium]